MSISFVPAICHVSGASRRRVAVRVLRAGAAVSLAVGCMALPGFGQDPSAPAPRTAQAARFLARRSWQPGTAAEQQRPALPTTGAARALPQTTSGAATWQPAGPLGVTSANYGMLGGRVSALALDPSDATGNKLYVGTTGGGVWVTQNAAAGTLASVAFQPLTDTLSALGAVRGATISIGAVTVQPGGTGVILAGTGDPNDALDSYYGAGILRSADNGASWKLIQMTTDQQYFFTGEGFSGFAWSTTNPAVVVAAVSQAYRGTLEKGPVSGKSYQGLYYSTDSGATWSLATISDGTGLGVQGPTMILAAPDGNAVTSVVWNPIRRLFFAAVRYHGYYLSSDGVTWTRMTAQPGSKLTKTLCPNNKGATGSVACPIFRGALAVNPLTGDTFAWTVDANNQDQGLWQDQCAISAGNCSNTAVAFQKQWSTAALQTSTTLGAATIANGDYNLTLAAIPAVASAGADTWVFAGANDLWKCSLAMGCAWRNTTNFASCRAAQVAGYQHAIEWNRSNQDQIYVGNDGGLWRSLDQVGQTGTVCASTDASHFGNLNATLGSLAEIEWLAQPDKQPYTMAAGLGVNGLTGVKSTTASSGSWLQILTGEGGPVTMSPDGAAWYANAEAGVAVYACKSSGACTPADFGTKPVISQADAGNDGQVMTQPAPILVDPLDANKLLVGTCRVWRGLADGSGWTASNAISPILDTGSSTTSCKGNSTIGALAAMKLASGGEIVYVGMHSAGLGGGLLPGHIFSATFDAGGTLTKAWTDLTGNAVSNDTARFNRYSLEVSSIALDAHDTTGQTVYVTVEGISSSSAVVQTVYRSTDGGASWQAITSNLPWSPANAVVVDPADAGTVYVGTDLGVYSTRTAASCALAQSACWAPYGAGLPWAPVTQLAAAQTGSTDALLTAATYGRGAWQIPLWTAGQTLTTAALEPASLSFASQGLGSSSSAQSITVSNTGSKDLVLRSITVSGDFSETDDCLNATVAPGGSCTVQVKFTPTVTGSRTGQLSLAGNLASALSATLSGTGAAASTLTLTPTSIDFGSVAVNASSASLQVTVQNAGAYAASITLAISGPFTLVSNACGDSVASQTACQLLLAFRPDQSGAATGTLSLTSAVGTQSVALSGTGLNPATDTLSATALGFPDTIVGQVSAAQSVTITNSGEVKLTSIVVFVSAGFQATSNCGTQLAASSSCTLSVVFAPTQTGDQSGTLTVSDLQRTQTVALSGKGLAPPVIELAPASLSFTETKVGDTSATQTLTVSNTGGAPLANLSFLISGPAASSFGRVSNSCGATLNNGSSCTLGISFTPALSGGNPATLTASSSTLGVSAKTVALNGTGIVTDGLSVSPAQLSFGTLALGLTSAAQMVTVTNTGAVAASALAVTVSAQYSLTQSSCTASLAAGASCTLAVAFAPSVSGAASGALTVSSSSYATPASVVLSGSGASGVGFSLSASSLSFGTVVVGQTSTAQTLTVSNTGAAGNLSNLQISVPSGFALQNNTCGTALNSGASCTVGVAFSPTSAGAQSGSLTVSASAGSLSLPVSGTGFDFSLAVSGGSTQSVSSGGTATYTLTLTPSANLGATFTLQCGTLPSYAACFFGTNPMTVSAGATGNTTVRITTTQGATAALTAPRLWPGGLLGLCLLLGWPLAGRRARRALLGMVLLTAFLMVQSCGGAGGGISNGPTGSTSTTTTTTPAGSYAVVVTAAANGLQRMVTLTLTVQ